LGSTGTTQFQSSLHSPKKPILSRLQQQNNYHSPQLDQLPHQTHLSRHKHSSPSQQPTATSSKSGRILAQ